jgi:hypothetical protein
MDLNPSSTPKLPEEESQESPLDLTQYYVTQRLTEHLGYLPLSFIDDVINSVNDLLYKGIDIVENYAEEALGTDADQVRWPLYSSCKDN